MANNVICTLSETEIESVDGGVIPLALLLIGAAGVAAATANSIMEFGAKIHDAVCEH